MQEMTKHPGWAVFSDFIVEQARPLQSQVLRGGVDSFDKYIRVVGELRGLDRALTAVQTVQNMVSQEQSRRDEAQASDLA